MNSGQQLTWPPPTPPSVSAYVPRVLWNVLFSLECTHSSPMALHFLKQLFPQVQCRRCCCSVTKSCMTFATPWTAACQASLSFTISQSLPKLKSIESWYHPTISSSVALFSSCPQSFPASGSFPIVSSLHHVVKLLQLQLQHQSYQWIFSGLISFRIDRFDLLAVQRTLESLAQHHSLKLCSSMVSLLYVQLSHLYMPTRKPQLWLYGPLLAQCFLIHCLGLSQLFIQGERSFNFLAAVTICSNFGAQ